MQRAWWSRNSPVPIMTPPGSQDFNPSALTALFPGT
jgi:hypothetical protein